eukprot:g24868.t1
MTGSLGYTGKGTLVNVSHRAAHGWVYAATVKHGEQASDPPSEGWVPHAVAKRVSLCRVAADWPEEGAGTLGLLKGDLIAVSKEAERGWVYGERISPKRPDTPVDGWLPKKVATARSSSRPKYHALIDSGALVTGLSNSEVAEYLLSHGLEGLDGVLFLNERNERVVLERDSMKIVELVLGPGKMGASLCGRRIPQRKVADATFAKSKVDLVKASLHMIQFLQEVERHPALYSNERLLKDAVRRYEEIWLPLLAKHRYPTNLIPPLDVEWVWHCHMLCPISYQQEAAAIAGQAPQHILQARSGGKFKTAKEKSAKLWAEATAEPFELKLNVALVEPSEGNRQRSLAESQGLKDLRFSRAAGYVGQVEHCLVRSTKRPFSFVEVCNPESFCPVVTAHSISFDQLPREAQVTSGSQCPFLTSSGMAFLIRVASEDVAVLIGHWQGFKLPMPGKPGTPGIPGDRSTGRRGQRGTKGVKGKPGVAGHLEVQLFALKTMTPVRIRARHSSPTKPSSFSVPCSQLGLGLTSTIQIDLASGSFNGAAGGVEFAFGYCLGLSIAALHVSLQPRMAPRETDHAVLGCKAGEAPSMPLGATMYPPFSVQQKEFKLLTAAGGVSNR